MSKKTPSLLTDHKLLIWLANVPARLRWIGLFAFLGGTVVIWAAFFFVPLLWRMGDDHSQIVKNEKLKETLDEQTKKGLHFKKENDEMESFLQNSVVPQSYQIADSLVNLANKTGIVCSSIVPIDEHELHNSKKKNKQSPCYKVGMKGTFSKVLQFLDQLQRLPAVTGIKNFTCSRTQDSLVDAILILEVMKRKV